MNISEEVQSIAFEQVTALFASAFERPVKDFAIDSSMAERLVETRIKMLGMFAGRDTPIDLRERFILAIGATKIGHEAAALFIPLIERATLVPRYSAVDMFDIAAQNLSNLTPGTGDAAADARTDDMRNEVLQVIKRALSDAAENATVAETVGAAFANRGVAELTLANLQAFLLMSIRSSLNVLNNGFIAVAALGALCRGMLYRTVVEDQGSQLVRTASNRAFRKSLNDVPFEILSNIPPFGAFVGPIKLFAELIFSLAAKEHALRKMQGRFSESYAAADEFVDAYLLALATWSEWANGIIPPSDNLFAEHKKSFLPMPTGSTAISRR